MLCRFALVGFEMVIVYVSGRAITRGQTPVDATQEGLLYAACALMGIGAFVGFYLKCQQINQRGYNAATQAALSHLAGNVHLSISDDIDDDPFANGAVTSAQFDSARSDYDELLQIMLQVWNGLLAIAILLWIQLRVRYHLALRQWHAESTELREAEESDEWRVTRGSAWAAQELLHDIVKEGYREVTKPLEAYLLVFVLFGIPAATMSSNFCAIRSRSTTQTSVGEESFDLSSSTYGTCDVWCELVLSFRTLATIAAYVLRRRNSELERLTKTWGRLLNRINGRRADPQDTGRGGLEMQRMDTVAESGVPSESNAWLIPEDSFVCMKKLGQGTFGDVWLARWKNMDVAVKIMKDGGVDEDGDPVNP